MTKPVYVFTREQIALMIALVANLDPAKYSSRETKSLILRAKAAREDDDIIIRIER